MSTARKARLESTSSSTQKSGLAHHASPSSRRRMDLASRSLVDGICRLGGGGGFLPLPQVGGRLLELGDLRHQLVIAVPLDEVRPTHVGPVLGGPPAVMPEVEVEELDRLVEGLRSQELVFLKLGDDVL